MRKEIGRKSLVIAITLIFITVSIHPVVSEMLSSNMAKEKSAFSKKPAQTPLSDPLWKWAVNASGIGVEGDDICVDAAGNTYVTGLFYNNTTFGSTTLTSRGIYDVFVAKLDANGNWLWAVSGGSDSYDYVYTICVDTSGNTYIIGMFWDPATYGSTTLISNGEYDVFVAKLDTNGNWLWAVQVGGTSWDGGKGICVDASGNVYITGYFSETVVFGSTILVSSGYTDVFVAKLDTNGNWQWAVRGGGPVSDFSYKICVDSNHNIYLTGSFYSTSTFGPSTLTSNGQLDVFIAKLDPNGNWLWAVSAGGTQDDEGLSISVDASGNTFFTGYFNGTAIFGPTTLLSYSYSDVFVAKLDTTGNWVWAISVKGAIYDDWGYDICVDASSTVYLTGMFYETAVFGSITLTANGGDDVFIATVDSEGNWLWAVHGGGVYEDYGFGIYEDTHGDTYATGYFEQNASFGPITLTCRGSFDVYVAMLRNNGNQPPSPPPITGPAYGKTNTSYEFSFGPITDPDSDQVYGLVDWGDDNTSGWLGPYASGMTLSAEHSWRQPGTYAIRLKLRDIYGAESDWSAPFTIIIVQPKTAFFLATYDSYNQTDDLLILHTQASLVIPSKSILYLGKTLVVSKDYRGYLGGALILGLGGVALP